MPSTATDEVETITVEVVAGLPERQRLVELKLPEGATVADAIAAAKIFRYFPEIDPGESKVGVWGELCEPTRPLKSGDRVEVYRELKIDPREARRQLARLGRTMRDGIRDDD